MLDMKKCPWTMLLFALGAFLWISSVGCSKSSIGCLRCPLEEGAGEGTSSEERTREATNYYEEASLFLKDKMLDEAIEMFEMGIALEPNPAAYNSLGMAYRYKFIETGDLAWRDLELEAFNKALDINPNHLSTLLTLGTTYYHMGRKAEALPKLKKVLEILPTHPNRDYIETLIEDCERSR